MEWRGDLSFGSDGLNAVDNFIFCMASYVEFDRIFLNYNPEVYARLSAIVDEFVKTNGDKTVKFGAILPSGNICKLLRKMGSCERFANVGLTHFVNRIDIGEEVQFCAMTYHLTDRDMFVCFRGTDDSIIGWKEDCKLSFQESIPAQKYALEYLEAMAERFPQKRIFVGGHSKGGNLAKYAAVYCSDTVRDRIVRVYSNDGPGLLDEFLDTDRYGEISDRIISYIPQSSTVGQMFENKVNRVIVKSTAIGIFQHDIFSWQIFGKDAIALEELSSLGKKSNEIFSERIMGMTHEQRREFVDVFFEIVDRTEAKTLTELSESKFKSASVFIKSFSQLPKDRKLMMFAIIARLFNIKATYKKQDGEESVADTSETQSKKESE